MFWPRALTARLCLVRYRRIKTRYFRINLMVAIRETSAASRQASRILAAPSGAQRTATLHAIAKGLRDNSAKIIAANKLDLDAGKDAGLEPSFMDRLMLNEDRVEAMARSEERRVGKGGGSGWRGDSGSSGER